MFSVYGGDTLKVTTCKKISRKEIGTLFFTSCIIIAFFCFAFYLIWNQFLKKDTRLSTGLKVLRKKISDLQNLSSTVETQVELQSSLIDTKIQRMEYLLKKSKEICHQLEKNIELALALKNKEDLDKASLSTSPQLVKSPKSTPHTPHPSMASPSQKDPALTAGETLRSSAIKTLHLKMVKDKSVSKPKQAYFGESPFVKLGFVESPEPENKGPSIDPPFHPPT